MAANENDLISIAFVCRPAVGGMRTHLRTLAEVLPEDCRLRLYAPADFRNPHPRLEHRPLAIGSRNRPLADLRSIFQLARRLRGASLVHAHGVRGALIGVPAARLAGIPSIITLHNLIPNTGKFQRSSLNLLIQNCSRVIAVSEAVALSAGLIPYGQASIIPNGVVTAELPTEQQRVEARAAFGLPVDALTILGIGRLSPEKGFDILLRAIAKLVQGRPDLRLLLVGSGSEESRLKALAADLKLLAVPHVIFTGQLDDLQAVYAAADLSVIPSRQEGQGIAALEAMAAGLPVVASNVGGLPETVAAGVTGLLAPSEDPSALAGVIHRLLDDAVLRSRLGAAGRVRVETQFSADAMGQATVQIYRTCLSPEKSKHV